MLELGGSYAGAYLLRRGLFMPWELPARCSTATSSREGLRRLDAVAPHRRRACAASPLRRTPRSRRWKRALYMRNQLLRDTDWASMAHSLEVRVPLVDSRAAAEGRAAVRASRSGSRTEGELGAQPLQTPCRPGSSRGPRPGSRRPSPAGYKPAACPNP